MDHELAKLITTLTSMLCVTAIALVYDGELALIAVGALVGLLAPSPFQLSNGPKRAEPTTEPPIPALGVG